MISDREPPSRSDPYAAWRHADFRNYSASWFLVIFAKMIETVAVGVHIYDQSGDPLSIGLVGLFQAIPVIILAIAGGQIADRYDRRNIIICTIGIGAISGTALLANAIFQGPIWCMYIALGIGSIAQAMGGPARAALLIQVVPEEQFTNAMTWHSSVFQIATMTGPVVGGAILGTQMRVVETFAAVLVCRVASFFFALMIRHKPRPEVKETVTWNSLMAGVRFVWNTKLVLATITLDLVAVMFGGVTYILPVFTKDILHVGPLGLGLLRTAEAVGAVGMAMLIAHLPPMRKAGFAMLAAVAGFGFFTAVFGVSTWFVLSMFAMVLIGACDNISVLVRHTLVQMLTPDEMRGRVSAVNNIFIVASNDLGGFESGLTAKYMGPMGSALLGGFGAIAAVFYCAWKWPEVLSIGALNEVKQEEAAAVRLAADEESSERV